MICFHFIIFVLLGTASLQIPPTLSRCDLLSFHYLCAIRNSQARRRAQIKNVVICFHFIIFVLLGTANLKNEFEEVGCDLLSFHYLCAIRNSGNILYIVWKLVVICFHFIIFVLLGTAHFALSTVRQAVRHKNRNKKSCSLSYEISLVGRDFIFCRISKEF